MAGTLTRKSYPLVKWLIAVSVVIVVVGLLMSNVLTNPNAADTTTLTIAIVVAVILPFLGLLMPRRKTYEVHLPSDRLHEASRSDLQGILQQLEAAKDKGELSPDRYEKAKAKVMAEMAAGKK